MRDLTPEEQQFEADLAMLQLVPRLIREVDTDEEAQAQADIGRKIIARYAPHLDSWNPTIPAALLGRSIGRPVAHFINTLSNQLPSAFRPRA